MTERQDDTLIATPSQTVGPFFHFALTARPGAGVVCPRPDGEAIHLVVRVTDGDGRPVSDAAIELWQASARASGEPARAAGFARLATDEDGGCEFETCKPPGSGANAGHINVCLFARGLLRQLHTRIYFDGDPSLATDPVLALVDADRRDSLLARVDPTTSGRWVFALRLQGAQETVFFDV